MESTQSQPGQTVAEDAGPGPGGTVAGELAVASVPLCVDLDGTLVKSDTLVDTVIVLARQSPSPPEFSQVDQRGQGLIQAEGLGAGGDRRGPPAL